MKPPELALSGSEFRRIADTKPKVARIVVRLVDDEPRAVGELPVREL